MVDSLAVLQAFAAGVLGFFAPCSIAMLPAYVSYYLRGEGAEAPGLATPRPRWVAALLVGLALLGFAGAMLEYDRVNRGLALLGPGAPVLLLGGLACAVAAGVWLQPREGRRALLLGGLAAGGILAVFALLGVPFVVLTGILGFRELSLLVLLAAAALVVLGVLGLAGRDLSFAVPVRAPQARTPASFALFGVAYGLVSMGCNLPLFLVGAVGPLARSGDAATALLGSAGYGAGMASVMLITTLSLSVGRGLTKERIRKAIPWVKRASNVVLILAGLYIAYYYWTVLRLVA